MVGDPKRGRSLARKAARASRTDEAWGERETGGSGRSSEDAKGQHNPGGAKDPWGSGVRADVRIVPTCLWPTGFNDRVAERALNGASNPATGKGGPQKEICSAVLEPYWGKPAVRNLRGGIGNVFHG
jgi:hypothetical protein